MDENTEREIREVHRLLIEGKLTVSVAESCTGGLLSHYLTYLPGASEFFKGGIIAYSNEAKTGILGVSGEMLSRFGAISYECAREMAGNARRIFDTDYALSTTGNLGPDTLEGKEVGLVYIALENKEGALFKELKLSGSRERNKDSAASRAISLLIEAIKVRGPVKL